MRPLGSSWNPVNQNTFDQPREIFTIFSSNNNFRLLSIIIVGNKVKLVAGWPKKNHQSSEFCQWSGPISPHHRLRVVGEATWLRSPRPRHVMLVGLAFSVALNPDHLQHKPTWIGCDSSSNWRWCSVLILLFHFHHIFT